MSEPLIAELRELSHKDLEDGVHEQIAAALEAKWEAAESALSAAVSDLEWAERTLPGTNFRSSILAARVVLEEQGE